MEITFKLNENGELEMDVSNAPGKECEKATESMIENLGSEIISQNFKPEYFDSDSDSQPLLYQNQ